MTEHDKIATKVFEQYGLNFADAERAGGWINTVWLNGDHALRLSADKGGDRLRREVARCRHLPPSVGYPANIATGETDGYEWSLSKRVQGKPLSNIWNELPYSQKSDAVMQILSIMNDVHSVQIDKIEAITPKTSWYNSFDKKSSFADAERYIELGIFTPAIKNAFCEILELFFAQLDTADNVLCHGDITANNLLWNDNKIVSLLDFEHAVIAPRQLDVHSVVNLCDGLDIGNLFKPYLYTQKDKNLFIGYSILFQQRFLEFWIAHPLCDISKCDPYNRLLQLCDTNHGYLSELINEVPK
ncbi:MAG: aminoglycoside phosphotransferase family protein [Defluviitaleaceae bacterium]|nr:aminoglycoside phosphotransferase family protein [Defluviitaleaceae bacterium]